MTKDDNATLKRGVCIVPSDWGCLNMLFNYNEVQWSKFCFRHSWREDVAAQGKAG